MKSVLLIAPYFLPRRRVGSLRPYKFAIHLKNKGWTPTILTIKDSSGELSENEKKALEGVEIIEVYPPFDRTTSGKPQSSKKKESGSSKNSPLLDWFDRQIPMDSWIFLFMMKYRSIKKQVKDLDPDLIWSTGDPWSGHWLGNRLSAQLKKPWIADFRDPWTLTEMNLRGRSRFSASMDRLLEKKFVEQADRLVFTSKNTEKAYSEHYGLSKGDTATIYNAFETGLQENSPTDWEVALDEEHLNILFFGRFRRLSPAKPIAEILKEIGEKNPALVEKIRIHSFGKIEPGDLNLIDEYGLEDQFVIEDPVLPEQAGPVMKKADLLFLSTSLDRKNIIPAKLWDYLPIGKPILSIAPNPEIKTILEETGAGRQFGVDQVEEIAQYLESLADEKKEKGSIGIDEQSAQKVEKYSAEQATKKLAEIMDKLTGHG